MNSGHIKCKVRQFKNNKNNIYYKALKLERTNSEKLGAAEFNTYRKEDYHQLNYVANLLCHCIRQGWKLIQNSVYSDHSLFAKKWVERVSCEIKVTRVRKMRDKYLLICIAYENNCLVLSRGADNIIHEYTGKESIGRGERSLYIRRCCYQRRQITRAWLWTLQWWLSPVKL